VFKSLVTTANGQGKQKYIFVSLQQPSPWMFLCD